MTPGPSAGERGQRMVADDGHLVEQPPGKLPQPICDLTPYLEVLEAMSGAMYIGPFRNIINLSLDSGSGPSLGAQYYDLRIGDAFVADWETLKAGDDRTANEVAYTVTRDIERIFGFSSLDINKAPGGRTLQLFLDGRSYRLPELGSGLAQFIAVLAQVARRQPAFVLIDEPELNLHPTLQIDFLLTLASYATHGVLFSTQSLGLARASADQIYSVRRVEGRVSEVSEYESTSNLAEFAGELSFAGYRELGVEQILLVEGPSDLRSVQQFLRLFHKDHSIVLIHLGGASSINPGAVPELLEMKRLSGSVNALIDSERTGAREALSPDREGFRRACETAGVRCHTLKRRALENYFTDQAVRNVKGPAYRALRPYERLSDVTPAWSKRENWRIARQMTRSELATTDLGKFLASL
jgi:hypothetical protein